MIQPNNRILIVDDNTSIHEDFKKVLGDRNAQSPALRDLEKQLFDTVESQTDTGPLVPKYEIDSAFQGEEALRMVGQAENEGRPYALLFMDIRMPPGWDGIETTRRIWEKYPNIEVVVCTAYSDYSGDEIVRKLGVTDRLLLLKKPYDPIVVKQFALALTTKWNLGHQVKSQIQHLEDTVARRTAEMSLLIKKLSGTNDELEKSLKRQSETQALLVQSGRLSALGEMAGGIAHEINNPVAIIHASASQLKRLATAGKADPQIVSTYLNRIEETSLRIAKIVKGLSAFARDGEQEPFLEVSVETLIEDTLGLCRERFRSNGVQLEVTRDPIEHRVQCRPTQVSQVLLNLLNNAFDAVSDRPEKWVNIKVSDLGDTLRFSVTDSGKEISEEVRGRMMQPFFTTKEIGKGTGLGLSISKGLVESHRGSLALDTSFPHTRFNVDLPKVQQEKQVAA